MSTADTLQYLADLEMNNTREWYHAHKKEHEAARGAFRDLVQELMFRLAENDPDILFHEPGDFIYRLVRDTRYSRSPDPYHTAYRAHIAPRGRMPIPVGFYLHIQPGNRSFLGAGLSYSWFKEATMMIRRRIADNEYEWEDIVSAPDFCSRFEIKGEKLKNVPRDFPPFHPQGEYLKHKSWYVQYPVRDAQVRKKDFAAYAAEVFEALRPFNNFLNAALEGFAYPEGW